MPRGDHPNSKRGRKMGNGFLQNVTPETRRSVREDTFERLGREVEGLLSATRCSKASLARRMGRTPDAHTVNRLMDLSNVRIATLIDFATVCGRALVVRFEK